MKRRTPRGKRGELREEDVVEAARKLFREKGYHGTSMQDIGDLVGAPKGSLYQHIDSKEALLFHTIGDSLEWTVAQLEAIGDSQEAPLEKLKKAIRHHVNATVTRLSSVGVLLEDAKHLSGARRRGTVRQQKHYEEILQGILEEGMQAGQLRRCDVKMVSFAILGMCNWIYRWYDPQGRLTEAEIAQIYTEFILRGIGLQASDTDDGRLVTAALRNDGT